MVLETGSILHRFKSWPAVRLHFQKESTLAFREQSPFKGKFSYNPGTFTRLAERYHQAVLLHEGGAECYILDGDHPESVRSCRSHWPDVAPRADPVIHCAGDSVGNLNGTVAAWLRNEPPLAQNTQSPNENSLSLPSSYGPFSRFCNTLCQKCQ
jgi:hypothetical protein